MKALRIAALGFALVAGTAAVASAQAAPQQAGRGAGRPNQQLKDIALTPEQLTKIDVINAKYAPEMKVVRDAMQGGGDRAEGMKKMNDLRARISPEIRAVLTAEQQAIYDKNTTEMKARMEAMAKQAPPAL